MFCLHLRCFKIPSFIISFCLENFLLPFFLASSAGEQILLVPLHLRLSWFSLYFWKRIAGYGSPGWQCFLSDFEKYCLTSFLTFMVSDEQSAVIQSVFPPFVRYHFFFSMFLVFRSLITMYLSVDFFGFILFGICPGFWICKFILHYIQFRKCSAFIPSTTF